MRPIHALLLVIGLAAALVGATMLVNSGPSKGTIATPLPDARVGNDLAAPNGQVSGVDGQHGDAARTTPLTAAELAVVNSTAKVSTIGGRVVDPEGRPVAGAIVYASDVTGFREIPLDEIDPVDAPWIRRFETKTDASGRFTLQPEARGAVRVAVRASGFAPLDAEKAVSGGGQDLGDFRLERSVVLSGRVVDSIGRPVAGAELHRARPQANGLVVLPGMFGSDGPVVATTDDGGRFRIESIASGPWALLVTSQDHPDKSESGETDRPGQVVSNLQITLEDGFEIAGTLVGIPAKTGPSNSAEELWVRAVQKTSVEGDDMGIASFTGTRRTRVDPDGSFVVRGLKKGLPYRLSARSDNRGMIGGSRSDVVEAKSGDRGIVLQYRPDTALVFQVTDAKSGRPVTDMSIEAGYRWPMPLLQEGQMKPQTHFDGGRVRFPGIPQNTAGDLATLRIEAAGFAPFERKDLRLISGQDNDLGTIRLEPAATVSILVVEDSTGEPLAGAQVTLNEVMQNGAQRGMTIAMSVGGADDEEEGFFGGGAAHRGKTDAQGRVTVSSFPGKRATVSVRHKDHAPYKSATLDLPTDGEFEHIARLRSGGSVVVHVVDTKGAPVAGLSVDHRSEVEETSPISLGNSNPDISDAEGRAVFAHLTAGRHSFRPRENNSGGIFASAGGAVVTRIRSNGEAPKEAGWTEIDVVEGQAVELKIVAPERGLLTGKIREVGKPLVGASVRVRSKSDEGPDLSFLDQGSGVTTNGQGEYTLEKLEAGDYRVVVTHPSRAMPWEGTVHVGEGSNHFDADLPVAIVEGRVLGEDKKPIAGVRIRAEHKSKEEGGSRTQMQVVMMTSDSDGTAMSFDSAGGATPVLTDGEGRYKLRGVTPDTDLAIVATGKDVQRGESEVFRLAPDQVKSNVELVLKQGSTIDVVLRRANGTPGSGCIVRASREGSDEDSKTQFSGPDGKVRFTGLVPGVWKLECTVMGTPTDDSSPKIAPQTVETKVGSPKTLTFDIPN